MRPLWYKSDRPEGGILLALAFAAACAAWGIRFGSTVRECPVSLPDGRALIGRDLTRNTCTYEPLPPRGAASMSPEEHRRAARQKELMK